MQGMSAPLVQGIMQVGDYLVKRSVGIGNTACVAVTRQVNGQECELFGQNVGHRFQTPNVASETM